MKIEEAIRQAISYEMKIRDIYRNAAKSMTNDKGEKLLTSLAEDEQNHVDYLQNKLEEINTSGTIDIDSPITQTAILSEKELFEELKKIESAMAEKDFGVEQQVLSKALQAEIETSQFYKKMVSEFTGVGQQLFERFLSIENEHIDIVQAQLDYVMNTGYWFGIKEFDME